MTSSLYVGNRAERRRREARRETFKTPELVTIRRSILGPPAEGRPGPSEDNGDDYYGHDDSDNERAIQSIKNAI